VVMRTAATRRDRLISTHIETVRRIALRIARRCPDWIQRDDLISAGMVGLVEAADRFDETRQDSFVAFAERRIRGAIIDELRCGDMMPRRIRKLARRVVHTIRELTQESGAPPSDERIAAALGVTLDEYRDQLALLADFTVGSLDDELVRTPASTGPAPDVLAERSEVLEMVRTALDKLEPRDQTILNLHFIDELTFAEVGIVLSVTQSRVCQLLWRAIDRLRQHIGPSDHYVARAA
jgi:RNA polymerase sigma factor for flagellar operon FliA